MCVLMLLVTLLLIALLCFVVKGYRKAKREGREFIDQGGFTLIELLVVIAIIGILSAVVIGSIPDAKDRTPEDERAYCERYGAVSVKNVPIKCLKYFNIDASIQ